MNTDEIEQLQQQQQQKAQKVKEDKEKCSKDEVTWGIGKQIDITMNSL